MASALSKIWGEHQPMEIFERGLVFCPPGGRVVRCSSAWLAVRCSLARFTTPGSGNALRTLGDLGAENPV